MSAATGFLSRAEAPAAVLAHFRACRERGRLAHAYLFLGPAGSGKTRFARALARALFCASGEPCETCSSCRAIEHGNHAAVEIFSGEEKAAIDIAGVRELSARDRRRRDHLEVTIIEGAERLSEAALNALLKTLEEPSPGALYLLTAPSSGSLLPTIVSRCHCLRFPAAPAAEGATTSDRSGEEAEAAWRHLEAARSAGFFAETTPRDWLNAQSGAGEVSPRQALARVLDLALAALRRRWREALRAPSSGGDPLPLLEALVELRHDLERNVSVDLILEATFRRLRASPALRSPGAA